ncbi:MAG: translation initiation factor IF-3 [Holosporales bacterium]|jgi:translation initiation factor IF-3|nr:translation initiation factor IF-3 [Holosporales bacterium]
MSTRGRDAAPQNAPKVNEGITAERVLLIGEDGEQIGTILTERAMAMAREAGLDLVAVHQADEAVPVCKLLDYGKYKYEAHRKKVESRKNQKSVEMKEVQVRPSIGESDLAVKCKAMKKFIEAGKKVKLVLRFRGRELSHKEIGHEVVAKILEHCSDFAKEESPPKLEGSMIIAVLTKK